MIFTKIFTLLSWCIYESDIYLLILLFKINGNTVRDPAGMGDTARMRDTAGMGDTARMRDTAGMGDTARMRDTAGMEDTARMRDTVAMIL